MFASELLDGFSRTPFFVVAILFVPIVLGMVAMGIHVGGVGPLGAVGLFFGGLVTWTLTEYWLHRTLFHWEPEASWGPRFHFLLHGVHHHWPKDRLRLVMPPTVNLPLTVLFGSLFWLVLGPRVWFFHAGFSLGYMTYDLMHYYLHHGHPKAHLLRKLQGHHMSHHFNKAYKDKRFGVSSPIWDWVFHTNSPAQP
ncbi:Fatty acid hydroxylase-like protein [Vulgatibacter incomptus]|uniref:Fatty acid hydroxylase-like protein n=2 Tax=Vulgatibacter incomptus TaxID=1391653 RepID=A0A0K1PH93_9BACT|nr:Fatty acid hydroxylase-like protein [Vulgatibacter incomptus]